MRRLPSCPKRMPRMFVHRVLSDTESSCKEVVCSMRRITRYIHATRKDRCKICNAKISKVKNANLQEVQRKTGGRTARRFPSSTAPISMREMQQHMQSMLSSKRSIPSSTAPTSMSWLQRRQVSESSIPSSTAPISIRELQRRQVSESSIPSSTAPCSISYRQGLFSSNRSILNSNAISVRKLQSLRPRKQQ